VNFYESRGEKNLATGQASTLALLYYFFNEEGRQSYFLRKAPQLLRTRDLGHKC